MARAKQRVTSKTTTTKTKTRSKKRGNQKRCPACGRFI